MTSDDFLSSAWAQSANQNLDWRSLMMSAGFNSIFSNDASSLDSTLPNEFEAPVLPLRETIVFPRAVAPLQVGRDRSLRALDMAAEAGLLVVLAQKNPDADGEMRPSDLYAIGTVVSVGRTLRMPDGTSSVMVRGRARVRVVEWLQATPYLVARLQVIDEATTKSMVSEAISRATLSLFDEVVSLDTTIPEEAYIYALNIAEPSALADFIAQSLNLSLLEQQEVLELADSHARLQRLSKILAKRREMLEIEDRIHEQVQSEMDKGQREIFLREQLRAIQTELGEAESDARSVSSLKERLHKKAMPEGVRTRAEQEITRLAAMNSMIPEVGMTRNYIEWLLDLPWSEQTDDNLDIKHAARLLNERHFGLPKVKERVLEYMSVRKLAGERMRSPILCFLGPPGTGKTSLARSIADSLGRKFVRMSLGGVRDEAEIRGHRRTYIGALPGRIIQTMKRASTVNPLFVLDEIDKIGDDFRGDPAAALLEVLDPEQNFAFEDHYLDVPYDLSKVMWVTTANSLYSLPDALIDRMEIIEFPGYIEEEKLKIAQQFLLPRQIVENGLANKSLDITEDALRSVIREYTFEAGVRNLDRELATICRKVAHKRAENRPLIKHIQTPMLSKFLGPPKFDFGKMDDKDQVGVATGVAWTEVGGDLMPIEVTLVAGKGSLMMTGSLGEVMQESAQTAMSYARTMADHLGIKPRQFEKSDIHIHAPEGAVPKEGPSAGITIAVALISALTKAEVRRDVAMTGEITLRGRVLPIGGLRDKLLAAYRAGIRTFILPKKNEKDLIEVPKRVLKDMTLIKAETMLDVLSVALKIPAQNPVARKPSSKVAKPRRAKINSRK
jgi:ATP-dependent Lon protease